MPSWDRSWMMVLVVGLSMACWGCGNGASDDDADGSNGTSNTANGDDASDDTSGGNGVPAPPPKLERPQVQLTEAQKKTCKVFCGQRMPEADIEDFGGKSHAIQDMYGEKLTVLHFWTDGQNPFLTEDTLLLLQKDVFEPFEAKGVRVIGINEGDSKDLIGQRMAAAEANFPMFLDPEAAYFNAVATEGLPRTYLLDSQGTILWFDLEFSEATREELLLWIRIELGEI